MVCMLTSRVYRKPTRGDRAVNKKFATLTDFCYPASMPNKAKTPVFFIATKANKEPVVVNFYTKKGKLVAFRAVKKVMTREGVHFYTQTLKSKKR